MKDISNASIIIPDKLAAFVYKQDEGIDVLHKIISKWRDVEYLYDFYEENKETIEVVPTTSYDYSFSDFLEEIMCDLEQLEDFIESLKNGNVELHKYFIPLSETEERKKILSLRKRRCKWLRIYAIQIAENLYVITGGAIKITKTMQQHKDTNNELAQLNYSRDWLKHQGIETDESFYLYFEI
ncbi:MAG: hypothetical protein KBA24_00860 [Dysgonomonadaceae bacterium]|jgi:hypothetical protein|nr:hypothetical protein [Dysgonamonadaceae bacterium]